ncbi:hypothetical protein C8R45DRAFT_314564 [Mycena sanguinolenta]|nr:hypothetical protein C8R45DRAFT_314564 [Mycena sanguinolenta]
MSRTRKTAGFCAHSSMELVLLCVWLPRSLSYVSAPLSVGLPSADYHLQMPHLGLVVCTAPTAVLACLVFFCLGSRLHHPRTAASRASSS